eukprot:scaffold8476_cov88-Phaeocystis_antarctica.AAC.2
MLVLCWYARENGVLAMLLLVCDTSTPAPCRRNAWCQHAAAAAAASGVRLEICPHVSCSRSTQSPYAVARPST